MKSKAHETNVTAKDNGGKDITGKDNVGKVDGSKEIVGKVDGSKEIVGKVDGGKVDGGMFAGRKWNLLLVAGLAVLVATEFGAAALAVAWALGGLFELSDWLIFATAGALLVLALMATVSMVRRAMKIHPIRAPLDNGDGGLSA